MTTTAKIPIAPALLNETKFAFQRKIKEMQAWREIPEDLIINSDQTPLPYICTGNRTYAKKGSSNVPLVERERKNKSRQLSQLLCLDHCFPCSLSRKERPIFAFQNVSIFLLILMLHTRPITGAMSPKQFNKRTESSFGSNGNAHI